MAAFTVLLVWATLVVGVTLFWKRLLGLVVTRFAHGRSFRLSVGQFFLAGLADVRLVLHLGPVREVCIASISVGLATKGSVAGSRHAGRDGDTAASAATGSGALWQALLSGQLLLPVRLQGVSLTLAPLPAAVPTSGQPGSGQQAESGSQPAAAAAGGGRRGRQSRPPLWLLAHLPLQLQDLTLRDEERGVVVRLQHASLSLHSTQQLLLEGLAACPLPEPGSTGLSSSSASRSSSPRRVAMLLPSSRASSGPGTPQAASPTKRGQEAQEAPSFFCLERLHLEHRHDGSFSLQQLQLGPAGGTSVAGAGGKAALQAVHAQLGAVSLTVSKQLLQWVEQQQRSVAAASQQRRAAKQQGQRGQPSLADRRRRLLGLLELLPKQVDIAVSSCSVSAGADGSAGADADLPIAGAFGLRGVTCQLARAARAEEPGAGSDAAALLSLSAGWRQLSASLAAAGGEDLQQLPSAIALRSSTAEWSLELSQIAAATGISQQPMEEQQQLGQQQEGQSLLAVVAKVSIGAFNTDVCHPAVQPLVQQLHQAVAAVKARGKPGTPGSNATSSATVEAAAPASGGPPAQPSWAATPAVAKEQLLAEWQASVSLGNGSRLLFTDAAGRCCWSNSLASCRLVVRGGSNTPSAPGAGLSGAFEAVGIEMHAVTSAAGSLAGEQQAALLPPPQMLAAQLLRVEVDRSAVQAAAQQEQQQQQQQGADGQLDAKPGMALALSATTAGVHLLFQQQQLSQVAGVLASLLPPRRVAPPPPDELAAAAELAAGEGKHNQRQRRSLRLGLSCTDTLLLLPITAAIPAGHAASSQLELLEAAPALLLSSLSGQMAAGAAAASADGCCLLYCEGPQSQRLPASSNTLKEQAKATMLSLDHAAAQQTASSGTRLEIGTLAACADADALLCLAAVADHAAQQLAPVLAALPRSSSSRSAKRRTPEQPQVRQPVSISVGHLRLAQPLYAAGRDMAVEVAAVQATIGTQQGCQHSLSTAGAVLTMDDTPVLRWRQLATTLRLPGPAGSRLAASPLPPPAAHAPAASGGGSQARMAEQPAGAGASYDAYQRARLEAWLDADAATSPSAAAGARDAAAAAALGAGPASVLDATVSGAELIVPHDGEPGPTERYAELYFKALETALKGHVQRLKQLQSQRRSSAAAAGQDGSSGTSPAADPFTSAAGELPPRRRLPLFPMQINLVADEPTLRFEHHPLEAWLASRGPLLQQVAVQQHLWGEVAAVVQPADVSSPLHAGMVENAFETVAAASQQAWDGLLRDLLLLYRSKLQQADGQGLEEEGAAARDAGHLAPRGSATVDGAGRVHAPPGQDLMRIGCRRLQGLVVLCAGSEEARAAALQQVAAVDPASAQVSMAKVLKLHADVAMDDFAMRLAGTTRPFVAAQDVLLSGTAAVARQATAPPQTRQRQLPVGAHRVVSIPVTVKGCRPPFKFFTDLSLQAASLTVCHSQGLEPTMALVALAGKRLSPSDPDKSVPRPPPIPWWDDMRYMWRGPVALSVASLGVTLGGTAHPYIHDTSERMEIEASSVHGCLLSGRYTLSTGQLDVTLHRAASVQQLGGTLLALPFVRVPHADIRLELDWKLPGGRPADQHHLFPAELPPAGTLQEPVHAGTIYKADGWDLSLHVHLGQPDSATAAGAPAVGFLGGHQIQWMKQFVAVMQRLPPQMRAVARKGSFFWRKPPAVGPPKKGLGKLTQKLCLNIVASPLEIVHYAADPNDPSHGIHLHAPSCSYTACYLLNQPMPSFLKLPLHARSSRSRRAEATRALTLSMDVQAGSVTVHKADSQRLAEGGPSGLPGASPRASLAGSGHLHAWARASREESQMLELLDDLGTPVTREQEPIIAAGTVAVTQDAQAPQPAGDTLAEALQPQGGRPLRVLISDCRVLVDRGARDAVWGAVEHLISAFTTSAAQQRRNLSKAALHPLGPLTLTPTPSPALTTSPSMPWSACSPVQQLQRNVSETPSLRASMPQPANADQPAAQGQASRRASVDGAAGTPGQASQPAAGQGMSGGESSNELLKLILQQGQLAGEEGDEQAQPEGQESGQQAGSDGLLHPGAAEDEEEEQEQEPLLYGMAGQAGSQQKYVVEVRDLQITSEAESARGRLLLASRSGRLQGLSLADAGANVTALLMEQVSAYVTQTDVDPDAPVMWLEATPTGYELPAGPGGMMVPVRRIFEPIQISMRHSKASTSHSQRPRQPSGRGRGQLSPGVSFTGSSLRGEELVLRVPEVLAVMDSREFEVLVDVVGMLQSHGPTVETVGAEASLLAELEGDEVEEARRLYALLRQQLADLRQASFLLRTSLGLQAFTSQLAPPAAAAGELLPPLRVTHFLAADSADFVAVQFATAAELSVAMREHLAAASAAEAEAEAAVSASSGADEPGGPFGSVQATVSKEVTDDDAPQQHQQQQQGPTALSIARQQLGERQREQQQALLLRWVEEQEGGAYEAVERAKTCLLALKAVARKRQPKTSALRLRFKLDRVVWQMVSLTREPFVQATIKHLLFDKLKNKDHSGSAKFVIGRIEVLDSQGVLGPGPGIGPGVILSVWNPDASWEQDDMLRVVMSMGVPTQTHVIYSHLDVILHPTAFHLNEAIAVAFWEYFFPREDESKAREAAAFARSVAVPAAAAARHRRSATALPAELVSSQQSSPMAGSPMRRTAMLAAGEGSQPSSGGQSPKAASLTPRGSGIVSAGWRSAPSKLHRRTSSAAAEGGLSRQSTMGGSATAAAAAAAADASLFEASAALAGGASSPSVNLSRPSGGWFRSSGGVASGAPESAGGSTQLASAGGSTMLGGRLYRPLSSLSLAASEDATAMRAAAPPHRTVRFLRVKVNRAYCRATYEGHPPLTFTDLKLVIDNRTYLNIEGRWRDLFSKMQWDIVKSVVKSVAGLQGRKFKELLPEGFRGEDGEGAGRRKTRLFSQVLGKGRKDSAAGASGEAGISEEDLRNQHKRRMLVGETLKRSSAALPPTPATTPAAGAPAAAAGLPLPGGGVGAAAPGTASPGSPDTSPLARSAAASGSSTPKRGAASAVDEVAGVGEVFPPAPLSRSSTPPASPLAAGLAGRGPLAAGRPAALALEGFGSITLPDDIGRTTSSDGGAQGGDGARATEQLGRRSAAGAGSSGGSRGHLPTPKWAAKLASKAQKGFSKLRESLQE